MAYSKAVIAIPSIEGDISITVTTEQAVIEPIEMYDGNASDYQLNKKFSGTSIVDGNGYYILDLMPIDINMRPYLCISGVDSGSTSNNAYKITYCTNGAITAVVYSNDVDIPGQDSTHWSVDMAAQSNIANYDGIMILIEKGNTALTADTIFTTDQLSIKMSPTNLYAA